MADMDTDAVRAGEPDEPVEVIEAPAPPPAAGAAPDPLSGLMLRAVFALLLVLLVGALSLIVYLLSVRGAPRTQNERSIIEYEAAVKEQPKEVENWAALAEAYTNAKRFGEAAQTIQKAQRQFKTRSIIYVRGAQLLVAQKSYSEALKAYGAAEKVAIAEFKAIREDEAAKGIAFDRPNPYLPEVYLGMGQVHDELKRPKDAVTAYRKGLEYDPYNATLLSKLGGALFELGKTQEAEEAFTTALDFVPDYAPALEGMQKIREAESK